MEVKVGATLEHASKPSWKAETDRIHTKNYVRSTQTPASDQESV